MNNTASPTLVFNLSQYRFEYLTPRLRLTPRDLDGTDLEQPEMLHFICSPARASDIISEVELVKGWAPITIFEPIPVCEKICDMILWLTLVKG